MKATGPKVVFFVCLTTFSALTADVYGSEGLEIFGGLFLDTTHKKGMDTDLRERIGENGTVKVWVQFADKGFRDTTTFESLAKDELEKTSPKTIQRRGKGNCPNGIIKPADLPVYRPYIEALIDLGARERVCSRWFNAVSVECTKDTLGKIADQPFVYRISPVVCFDRKRETPASIPEPTIHTQKGTENGLEYGLSRGQIKQIRVDLLHELGLTGKGVTIGVLDEGYAPMGTVRSLRSANIVGMRDFVDGDSLPFDTPGHGTSVLSVMAADDPGNLVGAAFGADYLLARTEVQQMESAVEEDFWVAGLEWLESQGADVVNSSLGYDGWYGASDYDGKTAVTTIAAEFAVVEKGVFIVNSAGNEEGRRQIDPEYPDYTGSLVVPADGEHVCTVGAVDSYDTLWQYSSRGPTFDGRIKPDVCARGAGSYIARASLLDRKVYDTAQDPAVETHVVEVSFTPKVFSKSLWVSFVLVTRQPYQWVGFGMPVGEFTGGLEVRILRGTSEIPVFDREFDDASALKDPWPNGFSYDGDVIVVNENRIETPAGNIYDKILILDLSSNLPANGLLDTDWISIVTSHDPASGGALRIMYITETDFDGVQTGSGTSYAAPMVAGAAALLLEARPDWGPSELLKALQTTATLSNTPNNDEGYGIADAYSSLFAGPEGPDLSLNGSIEEQDFLLFKQDWQNSVELGRIPTGIDIRSDVDGDGKISGQDLFILGSLPWDPAAK